MNCESLPLLMNAALDDELSPAEREAMQQHLADCATCRDQWAELRSLDRDLSTVLSNPHVEKAVGRVMQSVSLKSSGPSIVVSTESTRRITGQSHFAVVTVVCSLLVIVGIVFHWTSETPAVAEISLATGPIEYKHNHARDWVAMNVSSRVPLPPLTRVRTKATGLCEIRTTSDAVVRLNRETELVLHRPEKVELVTGELWCRAPSSAGLEVCTGPPSSQDVSPQVFTCPSATEMQWSARPDQPVACMDVAGTPAEIKMPEASCTIQPGECVTFGSKNPGEARRFDTLQATSWQLPLLLHRNPRDSELQSRLTSMLAVLGETKAAYLYEDQIRELGPPGAIPLLAFVRSPDSLQKPELRLRAMRMAMEQAGESALPDLEKLLGDDDPIIRKLAGRTIERLQPKAKASIWLDKEQLKQAQ